MERPPSLRHRSRSAGFARYSAHCSARFAPSCTLRATYPNIRYFGLFSLVTTYCILSPAAVPSHLSVLSPLAGSACFLCKGLVPLSSVGHHFPFLSLWSTWQKGTVQFIPNRLPPLVVILDVRAPKLAPATFRNTIGYILQVSNSNIYTSLHTAPQQFHTRSGSE